MFYPIIFILPVYLGVLVTDQEPTAQTQNKEGACPKGHMRMTAMTLDWVKSSKAKINFPPPSPPPIHSLPTPTLHGQDFSVILPKTNMWILQTLPPVHLL